MTEVAKAGAARKGKSIPESQLEEQAQTIKQHFDAQEDAFYTSGRVLDHGIIDPRDTRKVLAFCLETIFEGRNRNLQSNSFGVARM
jgi:geranyl-CoA carboxylase beta subunit